MPSPSYNRVRNVLEWIYYNKQDNNYVVSDNLYYALASLRGKVITYYYIINDNDNISECSSHTFEGVIEDLYRYPNSFSIPKKYLSCYNKQQVEYLEELKKYLIKMN